MEAFPNGYNSRYNAPFLSINPTTTELKKVLTQCAFIIFTFNFRSRLSRRICLVALLILFTYSG